jgi:hypothetical protein
MNAPAIRRSESIGYQHCNQRDGIASGKPTFVAEIVNAVRASRALHGVRVADKKGTYP